MNGETEIIEDRRCCQVCPQGKKSYPKGHLRPLHALSVVKKEKHVENIELDGVKFLLNIYYENRRSSRASIGAKSINIRIPFFLTQKRKDKELEKLKSWVMKKLKQNIDSYKTSQLKEYRNNDRLHVGNREYILKIVYKNKKNSSAKLQGDNIYLYISEHLKQNEARHHISTLLSRVIGGERLPKLEKRIKRLNEEFFKQPVNKISFRHQRSRWGSCSSNGNVNISTRLLFAPDDVLEYVCIHELAHLIHMNHSNKFWDLIEEVMPDYKDKKKWLKTNGDKCSF